MSRADNGEILVTQTIKAVSDHQAPILESANVRRDAANRLHVDRSASDEPASIQSVQLTPSVDGTGGRPSFMRWQSGTFQSSDVVFGADGFCLRSERSGKPGARSYTVTVAAIDHAGNESTRQLVVTVPHDQRGAGCSALGPGSFLGDDDPRCVFANPPIIPPPPETPPVCETP